MNFLLAAFSPFELYTNTLIAVGGISFIVSSIITFIFMNYLLIWALVQFNVLPQSWSDEFIYILYGWTKDFFLTDMIIDFLAIPFDSIKFIIGQA